MKRAFTILSVTILVGLLAGLPATAIGTGTGSAMARNPEDILALEFKGDLLVMAGDEDKAFEAYN